MAFETSVSLKDCKYTYSLHPNVKKYTLRDNTFAVTKVGNYELNRLLENDIIQQKFYFLMDSLVEREIFNKTEA